MLDHISLSVSDLEKSAVFYDAVLAPLGYVRVFESASFVGYAPPGEQNEPFAIRRSSGAIAPPQEMHIAFAAGNAEAVRRFHAAALNHGAKSDGAPGFHSEYGPNYYAAFVMDRDGYRIEAVCHDPRNN